MYLMLLCGEEAQGTDSVFFTPCYLSHSTSQSQVTSQRSWKNWADNNRWCGKLNEAHKDWEVRSCKRDLKWHSEVTRVPTRTQVILSWQCCTGTWCSSYLKLQKWASWSKLRTWSVMQLPEACDRKALTAKWGRGRRGGAILCPRSQNRE